MMPNISKIALIEYMTESLAESISMYEASKTGEFDMVYGHDADGIATDKYPSTKTAIQRRIILIREELLSLSKEL